MAAADVVERSSHTLPSPRSPLRGHVPWRHLAWRHAAVTHQAQVRCSRLRQTRSLESSASLVLADDTCKCAFRTITCYTDVRRGYYSMSSSVLLFQYSSHFFLIECKALKPGYRALIFISPVIPSAVRLRSVIGQLQRQHSDSSIDSETNLKRNIWCCYLDFRSQGWFLSCGREKVNNTIALDDQTEKPHPEAVCVMACAALGEIVTQVPDSSTQHQPVATFSG